MYIHVQYTSISRVLSILPASASHNAHFIVKATFEVFNSSLNRSRHDESENGRKDLSVRIYVKKFSVIVTNKTTISSRYCLKWYLKRPFLHGNICNTAPSFPN